MWNEVIGMAKIDSPRQHPHQKPVRLLRQLIEDYTQPGGVVLDITGGIGSTLLACELSGRKCLICEINKEYYDLMIKRYNDLTSK